MSRVCRALVDLMILIAVSAYEYVRYQVIEIPSRPPWMR